MGLRIRDARYSIPRSISECKERLDKLQIDRERIERQLGECRDRDLIEKRWRWRNKAKTALRFKTEEYRFLKKWLGRERRDRLIAASSLDPDPEDPVTLLATCMNIMIDLKRDDCLNPGELELLETVKNFFRECK